MMPLNLADIGQPQIIKKIGGSPDVKKHLEDMGFNVGGEISIVKNDKNRPVIVYTRDTMIALNEKECNNIEVQEGS